MRIAFLVAVAALLASGAAYAVTAQSTETTCGFNNICTAPCPHYTLFTLILGSKAGTPTQIADCSAVENDRSIRVTCSGDKNFTGTFASGINITMFGLNNCCTLQNVSAAGSCTLRIVCNGCPVGDAASVKYIW